MKAESHPRKIAVIGSGISGLSAAWLLKSCADITLYESDSRFGGHTHTYEIHESGRTVPVDTGFMVYNDRNYPNLVQLFKHLGVKGYPTIMSFSVSLDGGNLEYAGTNLNTVFGQRSNILKPGHWKMLRDIVHFNKTAQNALPQLDESISLGVFLDTIGVGNAFRHYYLYPMAAAIWSCPREQMKDFPASRFIQFFANHGLLSISDQPQWHTVQDGSWSYLYRMLEDIGKSAICNNQVLAVDRDNEGAIVHSKQGSQRYDDVIFACHSDQALALLSDPSPIEISALSTIPYQPNRVILHSDHRLMPKRERVWSSWNFTGDSDTDENKPPVSVTYWMNSLQRLDTNTNYFVSLNPTIEPDPGLVVDEFSYDHPVFGHNSVLAQNTIQRIQGSQNTWYCGAWLGYGFHEDGLKSAITVAKSLGAKVPWEEGMELQSENTRSYAA